MNRVELIDAIAAETGLTKKDIDATLKSFMTVVSDTLQKKESVQLIGFGSFSTVNREARKGVNPQTKKPIKIAAKKVAKFIPGKDLKELVNGTGKKGKK